MLKKLSLLSMLLIAFVASAQFTVERQDGTPILDGDTIGFNTNVAPDSYLGFFVNNENTTTDINVRIEFVSATNADGSELEICFGLCYTGTMIGQSYPINDVVVIPAGMSTTSTGDHFYNYSDGGGSPLNYVFRFFEEDGAGNEIGDDLTITYVYDATLGVSDNTTVNASIVSTVVNNNIEVNANEPLTFTMYDIQGRIVNQTQLEAGVSRVSVADLAAQTYLVLLTNDKGASQTTKVIVR